MDYLDELRRKVEERGWENICGECIGAYCDACMVFWWYRKKE